MRMGFYVQVIGRDSRVVSSSASPRLLQRGAISRRCLATAQRPFRHGEERGKAERDAHGRGEEKAVKGAGKIATSADRGQILRIGTGSGDPTQDDGAEDGHGDRTPKERKKFMVPVAVPSWCSSTAFWIATVVTGSTVPIPTPTTMKISSTVSSDRPVGRQVSRRRPAVARARPTMGGRL